MVEKRCRRDFSREELAELLSYCPETGALRWKIKTHGYGGMICPGDMAGTIKDGYRIVIVFGRQYRAHHLIWFIMTGDWPPNGGDMDHVNGVRDDNRWSNLRLATRSQNNMNGGPSKANRSGRKGVSWRRDLQKWHARIEVNGKVHCLGNFDQIEEAIAVRAAAENRFYGHYAWKGHHA